MSNQLQKIAADTQLNEEACQRIAGYAFGATLASPAVNLPVERVKVATANFIQGLQRFNARQPKLVDMLRQHVTARANA